MEDSLLFHLGFDPVFLLLGLLIFIIILFVLVISMHMKYNRLKSSTMHYESKDGRSMERALQDRLDEIDNLSHMAKLNRQNIKEIYRRLEGNYQKIGIVKYDAFQEMGGNLSFVLTLLDANDNGFVLNVMHSREGCYNYIKEIVKGESYVELSSEETESLEKAIFQEAYALKDIVDVKK